MIKAIFFDAAGTLFHLRKTVGENYAQVGKVIGLDLNPEALDRAFAENWKAAPHRPATGEPRKNDDKDWWRDLVEKILAQVAPNTNELDRGAFFEVAYSHFAEAGVWQLYPETFEILEKLQQRFPLGVISNFDGRLRMILEQFGVAKLLTHFVISSEVGADKPDPIIYRRALELSNVLPNESLHVGDDPLRDWRGAEAVGMKIFRLERPANSLRDLLARV